MTRLLVEEGGVRRSFKVGDGVLIIGSGESAALRLNSADVAAEHAELDVRGERVFLRARAGVVPPKVGGEPISGEYELDPGARIEIGAARIEVEFKGGARPSTAAPSVAPATPASSAAGAVAPIKKRKTRSGSRRGSSRTKRTGSGSRTKRPKSSASRRGPGRQRQQRPAWITPALLAGVVLAIVVFVKVIAPAMFADLAPEFEPLAHYHRANKALMTGHYEEALEALDSLPDDVKVEASMVAQMADLRTEIEGEIVLRDLRQLNAAGDEFLSTQLKSFEREHLQGLPARAAVRVFLARAAEFEQRWPKHGELEWVHRMQGRYAANFNLGEAPSYEDVEFEVHLLNLGNPRDFGEMFSVLERFMASCSAQDRVLAAELVEQQTAERQAWFEDKLAQARSEYDSDERGKSIEWLVRIVLFTGDPTMAAEGADRLVRFQDLNEYLRGYRRRYPERFEQLLLHPTIRDHVAEHPLD